jgi:hypothetical protein
MRQSTNRTVKWCTGEHKRTRSGNDTNYIWRVLQVSAQHHHDYLNVVAIALRETAVELVDQSVGSLKIACSLGRAFALHKSATRDLASSIHALFVIDHEWEEVDAFSGFARGS